MEAIVSQLVELIETHGWAPKFAAAIEAAGRYDVYGIRGIRCLSDYLGFIDDMVRWAPREESDSRLVHDKLVEFYFFFAQSPLRELQSPIKPGAGLPALTPLSQWISDYAIAWGAYLDTPASAQHIDSFRTNPAFHWHEYMAPPSGYLTFNQFFARHVKPGMRPIAALADPTVLVSPADANYIGTWRIDDDLAMVVDGTAFELKGLTWSILQLLVDSPYADRFAGGVFTHSALRTFDYHRWHSPIMGKILEARIIQGQASLDVAAVTAVVRGESRNVLRALEGTGYQFVQTRGLVVLDSPIGLVACLPVGMAQVSSVVITAERGAVLHKGEEMGYFQFGGSDFVMVFEARSNVEFCYEQDTHYRQGRIIGHSRVKALR